MKSKKIILAGSISAIMSAIIIVALASRMKIGQLESLSPVVTIQVTIWLLMIALVMTAWRRGIESGELRDRLLRGRELELAFQEQALNAHSIVSTTDPQGRIIKVNKKFSDVVGANESALLGRKETYLYDSACTDVFDDIIRTTKAGEIWKGETEFKRNDGHIILTECTVVPLMNRAGQHDRNIFIRTDVTQARLAQEERQLIQCLKLLPDDVFMFDAETLAVVYMNASAARRTGWKNDGWKSRRFQDVVQQPIEGGLQKNIDILKADQLAIWRFETDINGCQVEVCMEAMRTPDGRFRLIATARDITDRKTVEKKRNELVSIISHELRTPLTSIKGALRLVTGGAAGQIEDKVKLMLDIAANNSDRLLSLVDDILDLDKIDAGDMEFSKEEINASDLVHEALETYRYYGAEMGVEFVATKSDQDCTLIGDRKRLMQVMANLMSNAAKFSHPGDTVELGISTSDTHVRISVKDQGAGISDEDLPKVFARFGQTNSAVNSGAGKLRGTGLGLSIAKAIVQQHNGQIDLKSTLGKGTTFFFELPIKDGSKDTSHRPASGYVQDAA